MLKAIVGTAVIVACGTVAMAHPCQRLTCEELQQRVGERCPAVEPAPCEPVPCTAVPCQQVPCAPVPCTPVVKEVPKYIDRVMVETVTAPARGEWLIGGGPVHVGKMGLTAVGGYRFKSGVTLVGGPTYIPNGGDVDDKTCRIGCQTCTTPGWKAGREWGLQVMALVPMGGR